MTLLICQDRCQGCLSLHLSILTDIFFLKVFDELLEAMKSTLAENPASAFVLSCHNGKDRTTTAMVIATLTLWHFNVRSGFPSQHYHCYHFKN